MFKNLNNEVMMPLISLGTFKSEPDEIESALKVALEHGYVGIDTAAIYKNEKAIGNALQNIDFEREKLFITSKVWNAEQGYETTLKAFEQTLNDLQLDYLDLYLIHWPKSYELTRETWRAMEELYLQGKVKAIGISNFKEHHIEDLLTYANVIPVTNQVEISPYFAQFELQEFCEKHNITLTAHSHLRRGDMLKDPIIESLAHKYKKTPSNIIVRWLIQRGIFVLPKSVNEERIIENIDVYDFKIYDEDMNIINKLDKNERILPDPDTIDF